MDAVCDDVFESEVHETAVAAHIAVVGGAVDEFLFGEVGDGSISNGVGGFERADGGEGPAGAALGLVFDLLYLVLGSPVDGVAIIEIASSVFG